MLQSILNELAGMPRLMRIGLTLFFASGAIDVLYHVSPIGVQASLDLYLGHDAYAVHVSIFIGMLIILLGVFRTRPNHTR